MKQAEKSAKKPRTPSAETSRRRMRTGFIVFGALLSIKAAELFIYMGIKSGAWPYLLVLALVSAGLIAYYYKHIHQLWDREKHD